MMVTTGKLPCRCPREMRCARCEGGALKAARRGSARCVNLPTPSEIAEKGANIEGVQRDGQQHN